MITLEQPDDQIAAAAPLPAAGWRRLLRATSLGVTLWFYGLAVTVLLVGLWGRAVTVDAPTVESAAAEAAGAAVVSDRVVSWLLEAAEDELADRSDGVEAAVRAVLAEPAAATVVERVIGDLVAAALAPPGDTVVVDVAAHIAAVLPNLESAAVRLGEPEAIDVIRAAVVDVEPIRLQTGDASPVGSGLHGAGATLRAAAVVAGIAVVILGGTALLLATDRRNVAKNLAMRTALGGLGFSAMLQLGSWALDPGRGGAAAGPSLRRAGSVVLGSNLHVPLLLGMVGAAGWVLLRRRAARQEPSPRA